MVKKLLYFFLLPAILNGKVPSFDKHHAFMYLQTQCEFGPRIPGTKGHSACLKFLVEELRKTTPHVVEQSFLGSVPLEKKTARLTNVIASFEPSKKPRILLCAHWDTRAHADFDPNPLNRKKPVPGANDGASGTAVLLELACIFKKTPPPVGVDLVLFDGEDNGVEGDISTWCLGSRHFATTFYSQKPIPFPQYAILIDMIGDRELIIPVEINSKRYAPDLVEKIWQKSKMLGFSTFSFSQTHEVIDDHLELLKVGIPAADLIDLDYPYWHTTEDTPDKCSPESLYVIGTLLLHLLYE